MNEFPSRFDAPSAEPELYELWRSSGGFSPKGEGESRCILMPPPNANGLLHIGHAYEVAMQDSFIRYWRMRGYNTLWQPGVDHAGFETQVVFEKKLEKEGRTRFQMPREQLYQEIFDFSVGNQVHIRRQLERLGASCDWDRFKFMLDPALVKTVYRTFKELYEDGLIYRAKRPVNWCVKHQTSLSDLETKEETRQDPLYYITYGPLTVATVRPETKFGDTALAVHPDDSRYQEYIGQEIEIETVLGPARMRVIADTYVNPEFGTGVVKITPAHDPNDFEVAQRHDLPLKEVIDQYGRLNDQTGSYAGMKIAEAREKVVADLQAKGLITKVDESYTHAVKVCFKCGSVIEPRVLDQWWLAMTKPGKKHGKSLRDMAVEAVQRGDVTFLTKRYENQFFHWMSILRDWPLSRQIAWGIQLPVWYASDGSVVVTEGEDPENAHALTREADVFDTWFSSGQWPFSTLGSYEEDLAMFYPTTAIMPGYDILFFWVSRMLMLGLYTQGKVPFQTICLHGLVRDKDRQKMSKSKGNVIDPLGIAETYGVDAVRLALLFGNAPGTDLAISEEKIRGMRNFTTKLWNIARFVSLNIDETTDTEFVAVTDADIQIAKQLRQTIKKVTASLDAYESHLALETLHNFMWHDVADRYVEIAKEQLQDEATKATTAANLRYLVLAIAALLHPFAPFVTEAIWQRLGKPGTCIMNDTWPTMSAADV